MNKHLFSLVEERLFGRRWGHFGRVGDRGIHGERETRGTLWWVLGRLLRRGEGRISNNLQGNYSPPP